MPKKVLITGGAGFIGSALSAQLQEAGHEVFVLDDLSFGKRALAGVPDARFFQVDIRHRDAVQQVMDATRPNWVLHLAAVHRLAEFAHRREEPQPQILVGDGAEKIGIKRGVRRNQRTKEHLFAVA